MVGKHQPKLCPPTKKKYKQQFKLYRFFFTNNIGPIVQDEAISPILFAAYVNDGKMEFVDNKYEPIEIK